MARRRAQAEQTSAGQAWGNGVGGRRYAVPALQVVLGLRGATVLPHLPLSKVQDRE